MGRTARAFAQSLVFPVLTLSCWEAPSDPWTTELPQGSLQIFTDSARNAEFERAARAIPFRNEIVTPEQFVVRSQADWETFWTRTRAETSPPFVDWNTEMVVVVGIGRVAPPWENVLIAGVMANGADLYVLVYRDGINPACPPSTYNPFDRSPIAVALVPLRPGTPKYLERLQPVPRCY